MCKHACIHHVYKHGFTDTQMMDEVTMSLIVPLNRAKNLNDKISIIVKLCKCSKFPAYKSCDKVSLSIIILLIVIILVMDAQSSDQDYF